MPKSLSLEELLRYEESTWLDWKAEFFPGLVGGAGHPEREKGRAKVLRALAAIANSVADEFGYLVFGVSDEPTSRTVVGVSHHFDDSIFQTWNHDTFRPRIEFQYAETIHMGSTVGVFEITPASEYPHVCERAVGELLYDGQVWIRRGSRNSVAHRDDLRRMFATSDPVNVASLQEGPIVERVRAQFEPRGWELFGPKVGQKHDYLEQGCRVARYPGSRREIRCHDHVLMLRLRSRS